MKVYDKTDFKNQTEVDISVILCCYNSVKKLDALISNLKKIEIPLGRNVEYIFVDNNSTDGTYEKIVELSVNMSKPNVNIVIKREQKQGLAFARRCGVLAAKGDIGVFCDDDNILSHSYLVNVIEIFSRNKSLGVVGCASKPIVSDDLPAWFYSFSGFYACGVPLTNSGLLNHKGYVWGAGMSFRLAFLKERYNMGVVPLLTGRSGDLLISGDDSEICKWYLFAGYNLYYDSSLEIGHEIESFRIDLDYLHRLTRQSDYAERILRGYDFIIKTVNLQRMIKGYGGSVYRWILTYVVDCMYFLRIDLKTKIQIIKNVAK